MPTTDALISSAVAEATDATCFHCGLAIAKHGRHHVFVDGAEREMCCAGCAAVAETIVASGLADYYHHRSAPSARPDEIVPDFLRGLESYDIEQVSDAFVERAGDGNCHGEFMLEGVTCPACVWLVEQRLRRVPGIREVHVNYATERMRLAWSDDQLRLSQILRAVAEVGLRAHPFDLTRRNALRQTERRRRLFELAVAGLGMMQVMMYVVPVYLSEAGEIEPVFERLMRWASLLLTLPVVLFSARTFFSGAWRDLSHRQIGMDVPIAIAIACAFAASIAPTLAGHGEVYFDSVTMFIFLLLGARFLEAESRQRAAHAIERLSHALPAIAMVLTHFPANRDSRTVSAGALAPGDFALVGAGATVPADGEIVEGESEVDEALMSGESRPLAKRPGDSVVGGTLNTTSPLIVRVTGVGSDTVLSHIVRLADRALGEKPRVAQLADRIASGFSIAVLALAVITAIVWFPSGGDLWFRNAIAVLVVTCPCALALATPAALAAATGHLSGIGLLATRGHVLETFARVTDVIFDKTGTLTRNEMRVAAVVPLGSISAGNALSLAAALEAGSGHPVARALLHHSAAKPGQGGASASKVSQAAGSGVEGEVLGDVFRVGSEAFVAQIAGTPLGAQSVPSNENAHLMRIWLGRSGEWLARIDLDDPLRADARAALDALHGKGLRIHLVSGDRDETVRAVAAALEIDPVGVRTQATPRDKLAYIEALQGEGRTVAMVGDGINDAPVLARAQLSIAMGNGTDLARAHADMVLLSPRLGALAKGLDVARATRRVIRENLIWALVYNALAVPLAMAGWVSPWQAALGMSASSLLVVANATRLQSKRG